MDFSATPEEIAGAEAYQALHVPALFAAWAPHVLDAAGVGPGDRVLDVACGTGVLARAAAERVGDGGSVAGLDAGAGMLAVASRLAPEIDWRHGMAGDLPFDDATFDAVVSQFGLMFFPDRFAALREMLRVTRPGGRIGVAVWDALDRSEAYPEEVALLERLVGPAAADALRAPFVLGDRDHLADLFRQAGAPEPHVHTIHGRARFPSVRSMVEADLRGWLPVMGVHLDEERIETILAAAEDALADYVTEDGTVEFDAPGHIVTAVKTIAG
jgi:SAM-dependent methyltransferase